MLLKFRNEDQERAFWATHNATEYVDWKKAKRVALLKIFLAERIGHELRSGRARRTG